MNPLRSIGLFFFRDRLENSGPALTFARLCTSQHLEDLQWIAFVVLVILLVVLPLDLYATRLSLFTQELPLASALIAGVAAVLNWIYQTGSNRIGAVDLFACEISAICRVATVVDFATHSVAQARVSCLPGETVTTRFTSEENYTPVYDRVLESLQSLDVNVVTSVTEFYTYRKTMVDFMRAATAAEDPQRRHFMQVQMIYMQFLMYESARRSIDVLVEFEPNKAESLVNILCSELVLYDFLATTFDRNDFRGARLLLRRREYQKLVPALNRQITDAPHPKIWDRARTTAPEMMRRFAETCGDVAV